MVVQIVYVNYKRTCIIWLGLFERIIRIIAFMAQLWVDIRFERRNHSGIAIDVSSSAEQVLQVKASNEWVCPEILQDVIRRCGETVAK